MDLSNLPLWVTFLLTLGLVLRVSRLVVDDTITQPLRNKLHAFGISGREYSLEKQDYTGGTLCQKSARWVSKLVHCTWCTSVWVSALAVLSADAWSDTKAWNLVAAAATLSYLTGWISNREYND